MVLDSFFGLVFFEEKQNKVHHVTFYPMLPNAAPASLLWACWSHELVGVAHGCRRVFFGFLDEFSHGWVKPQKGKSLGMKLLSS